MGSAASSETTIMNNYHFTGNNNGIHSGAQSVGTAHALSTTDVSPKADLSYSQSINPSWWGTLNSGVRGIGKSLTGAIGNNSDLIQTFKHVGATALRVAMDDTNLKERTTDLVNRLLDSSTPKGSLTSRETVPFKMISDIADIQVESINKVSRVQDAYHTLSLGSTGMRNNEVSTQPTHESVLALYKRASPTEKQERDLIIESAGPKLGIVPKHLTSPPSDMASATFDNRITKYGRLGMLKKQAELITDQQNSMLFSILHSDASALSSAGVLKPYTLETHQFIGLIKQVSVPFTASSYPNGHLFGSTDLINSTNFVNDVTSGAKFNRFALSSYAFKLPMEKEDREVRIRLSGQIVIVNQPYDPVEVIELGFIYKRAFDNRLCFNKAVFINTETTINLLAEVRKDRFQRDVKKVKSPESVTNALLDVDNVSMIGNGAEYDYILELINSGATDGEILEKLRIKRAASNLKEDKNVFTESQHKREVRATSSVSESSKFSYSSQWQVALNLTNTIPISTSEAFGFDVSKESNNRRFNAIFVARYPSDVAVSVAVQTPTLHITIVKVPREMRFIGVPYHDSVLSLLGMVPDWYSTDDLHDPWKIYHMIVLPLINYAGKIAYVHIREGAAYQLTVDHVSRARAESGLPTLAEGEMSNHVRELIVGVGRWLSSEGPVAKYGKPSRMYLFMRIVEKVMFQSLTHIDVYADKVGILSNNYLTDCNRLNAIENQMDNGRLAM